MVRANALKAGEIGYAMSVLGLGSLAGMVLGGALHTARHVPLCLAGIGSFAVIVMLWPWAAAEAGVPGLYAGAALAGFSACIQGAAYCTALQGGAPKAMAGRVVTSADSMALAGSVAGSIGAERMTSAFGAAAGSLLLGLLMAALVAAAALLWRASARSSLAEA